MKLIVGILGVFIVGTAAFAERGIDLAHEAGKKSGPSHAGPPTFPIAIDCDDPAQRERLAALETRRLRLMAEMKPSPPHKELLALADKLKVSGTKSPAVPIRSAYDKVSDVLLANSDDFTKLVDKLTELAVSTVPFETDAAVAALTALGPAVLFEPRFADLAKSDEPGARAVHQTVRVRISRAAGTQPRLIEDQREALTMVKDILRSDGDLIQTLKASAEQAAFLREDNARSLIELNSAVLEDRAATTKVIVDELNRNNHKNFTASEWLKLDNAVSRENLRHTWLRPLLSDAPLQTERLPILDSVESVTMLFRRLRPTNVVFCRSLLPEGGFDGMGIDYGVRKGDLRWRRMRETLFELRQIPVQ